MVFSKTAILVAALVFTAGAQAQCPNDGVGVGLSQLCSWGIPGGGSYCEELMGFITRPGTWDDVTIKNNLNGPGDLCGGGWEEGAFTTCDGSTVVSVNSVDAGPAQCQSTSIVAPGSSDLGVAVIYYCCYY